MKVNPADLRFTQDSIGAHFKAPHEHFSVREALGQIQAGRITPNTFPKLRVYSYNGVLWSADNRRLWVFRMANCPEITVRIMSTTHPRLEEIISFPSRYRRLSKADFLPKVRGNQNAAVPQTLHPRVPDVMVRHGFSGQVRRSENALPLVNTASKDLITRGEGVNVHGIRRPPVQAFRPLEENALVVTMEGLPVGSVCEELLPVPKLSLPSFPEESGGRHLAVSRVTVNPIKPNPIQDPIKSPTKAIIDIGYSDRREIGEQRSPRDKTRAESPLQVVASTDNNDSGPSKSRAKSWFGRVTESIFGCFGLCE